MYLGTDPFSAPRREDREQPCPKDTSQRPAEIIYAVGKATELLDQGTEK